MLVNPFNPNAVTVSMVQTGCCSSEFDSNYPVQLNGVITRDEFQTSIRNINATFASKKACIFLTVAFILSLVLGLGLFVAGIVTISIRTYLFIIFFAVGGALFVCGSICMPIGCCIVQSKQMTRLNKAIADESAKYSTRSPTPCSWRLNSIQLWTGSYNRRNRQVISNLIIDIGNVGGNVASQQPSYSAFQFNNAQSAYGSNQGFCSRCGAPRVSTASNYCSSCGQQFMK